MDGYVPRQVTACPKSILLGHPSQYKHRDSPSRSCTPRDWVKIRAEMGVQKTGSPRYSPSQGLATLAPAHPCTGSSGAPIPGLAWFPHGTGVRGPQLCAHSPAMLWGVFSTLNPPPPKKGRHCAPLTFSSQEEGNSHWEVHHRDRMVICRGTSEESRAGETDPLRMTVGRHTLL